MFHCSIHFFMTGTLDVTDKGTPLPPPGSGSPPAEQPQPQPQQDQPQARDTTKPQVARLVKRMSLRTALRAGA